MNVRAGDTILFGKYSGQEIKLDGEEYLILREDEVLAIIEDGDAKNKTQHVSRIRAGAAPARQEIRST